MAAIDFPNSPTNGQIFNSGGKSWKYNSTKGIWQSVASTTTKNLTALDESIIPSANVTYDLGSSTNAFRDLYLSGNSIFLGAGEITSFSNGSVTLPEGSQVGGVTIGTGSGGATVYANTSLLPKVGLTAGEFAFVGNTLFITNGSGWYSVGVVNQSPELTLSTSSIALGSDGNTIDFTFTATDPDGPEPTVSISNSGIANTSVANINLYTANSTVTVDNFSGDSYNATITLTATDGINQTSASVTLTVSYLSELWDETRLSIGTSSTNSLDNSTFIDRSTNAHTVTPTGSPTQTAFHPYLDYWSVEFSQGYQRFLQNTSIPGMGTSDFTIEAWIWHNGDLSEDQTIFANAGTTSASVSSISFQMQTNGYLQLGRYFKGNSTGTTAVPANQWVHVAVERSGSNVYLYVNGQQESKTIAADESYGFTGGFRIGEHWDTSVNAGKPFGGYISNLRVVKGSLVYNGSFTPPTEKLTPVTNTILLTCQDNRFKDNSTNGYELTINDTNGESGHDNPKISAFNPFGQGSEYAVGENKGSSVFPTTSDYLECGSDASFAFGTGDYTVEFWYYSNLTNGGTIWGTVFDTTTSAAYIGGLFITASPTDGQTLIVYHNGGTRASGTISGKNLEPGEWTHCAVTRSGSNINIWINGVLDGTGASGGDDLTLNEATVGRATYWGTAYSLQGGDIVSDLRVTKGTALYTTTFTPPTAPLGNTNASLYLPMDNAGIFDKTGNHTLTLLGDAATSTTQTKFADTAMYFDGSGDGIQLPSESAKLGSGDFTIEFWVRYSSISGYITLAGYGYGPQSVNGWIIQSGNGDGKLRFYTTPSTVVASDTGSTVNTNQWYHIAVVRSSGTVTMYRDGTSVGSGSSSVDYSQTTSLAKFYIGGGSNSAFDNYYLNGYIENFQILKGVAKYTSNFTPPTQTQGRAYQAES